MKKIISIYVTFPNKEEAQKVSNILLEKKYIACINYSSIDVSYHWKWSIVNENEIVTLLKTRAENWEKVRDFILEKHSYEIPCIIKYEVEANEDYVKWIYEETI